MAKHPIRKFQRLTTGDDAFRAKFRSWDMTELSYVDIKEYLKDKGRDFMEKHPLNEPFDRYEYGN